MSNSQFRMIACPSLNHERRIDRYFESGRTLADYLRELGWRPDEVHARVTIDGQLIPDAEWQFATPKAGQAVVVRSIPQGGDAGKQAGQIVGMIALVVASAYIGGGGLVGTTLGGALGITGSTSSLIAAAVVGVGGSLALNGPIPKPLPRRVPLPMRDLKEAA